MLEPNYAKILMGIGSVIFLIGFLLYCMPPWLKLGSLPGDFYFKSEGGSSFYFPLTTSLLLSILLSAIFALLKKNL